VVNELSVRDVLVVGNGSNMLVADSGYHGLAVVLDSVGPDDVLISRDGTVEASGHISLPQLARQSVAGHRCGLEWAVGVPGTVGGGVRMNAGGHGSDMASSVIDAHVVDMLSGRESRVSVSDLGLRFRGSALRGHHVVVSVRCATNDEPKEGDHSVHEGRTCAEEIAEIVRWRRDHQPGGQNAGSVFVNPGVGTHSAGALIDSTGARGLRRGSAVVTEKHANFIQSEPHGRADDVVELMCVVQDMVHQQHGIRMRSEIALVGFANDLVSRFADDAMNDPHVASAQAKLDAILANGDPVL
jgi:UDP-N-acetylmuramate dehydrogenase